MFNANEKLLRVEDVLSIVPISRNQLYRDIQQCKIATIHFGRNVRFSPEEVTKYKKFKSESKKVQVWQEKKQNCIQQKT